MVQLSRGGRNDQAGDDPARSDAIGVIELEMLKLVRHLETVGRKGSLYDEVDRAGYLALRTLEHIGPVSVNALARALRLDPSTVTRQVAKLAEGGLVDRETDPHDGRSCLVAPTPAGRRAARHIEAQRRQQTEQLLLDWSPEERRLFGDIMTKLNVSILEHLVDIDPPAVDSGASDRRPSAERVRLP